jgi:pyruvate formate lyase activating enzyme
MVLQCELCPKRCMIEPGQSGECRIRVNMDGRLVAVTYGFPVSVHVDPIEKKPIFHFLPGSAALSIATVGCNLHCKFCQNWEISQQNPEEVVASEVLPEHLPHLAGRYGCRSIAYTYTDPVVYYEYTLDGCIAAREAGLKNILVTAGYISREPLKKLCALVDAANIDIKAFSEKFYRDLCGATLKPVLEACVIAKTMGVLVEITNLLVPTQNDGDMEIRALCKWMVANLGAQTPLHFSRFFPKYKMINLPPTPAETLIRARDIARSEGLQYVYVGNIMAPDGGDTFCPKCRSRLIERRGFSVLNNRLKDGHCPDCGGEVYGVWNETAASS